MGTKSPVALVTGASRGLGRGIALELAKNGFSVAINYARDRSAALECARSCRSSARNDAQKFAPLRAEIGDVKSAEALVRETLSVFGRIDALVNNAGVAPAERRDLTSMTEESFNRVLRVNLQGPFFLTQTVAKYWLGKKLKPILPSGFKVVFVSSISALAASLNRGEYCISKAGLSMASTLWSLRLADHGVQVYEVRPGVMATDMTSAVSEKYDKQIGEGLVPLKRWGTPGDVGKAVRSLLAGDFPFSTGEVIYIDGGLHIQRL